MVFACLVAFHSEVYARKMVSWKQQSFQDCTRINTWNGSDKEKEMCFFFSIFVFCFFILLYFTNYSNNIFYELQLQLQLRMLTAATFIISPTHIQRHAFDRENIFFPFYLVQHLSSPFRTIQPKAKRNSIQHWTYDDNTTISTRVHRTFETFKYDCDHNIIMLNKCLCCWTHANQQPVTDQNPEPW